MRQKPGRATCLNRGTGDNDQNNEGAQTRHGRLPSTLNILRSSKLAGVPWSSTSFSSSLWLVSRSLTIPFFSSLTMESKKRPHADDGEHSGDGARVLEEAADVCERRCEFACSAGIAEKPNRGNGYRIHLWQGTFILQRCGTSTPHTRGQEIDLDAKHITDHTMW